VIVNADDLGYDVPTTDAILACFELGRITSATAMVYMRDSARAASIASAAELPVGLHVNLTEPYSDAEAPDDVRALQARVAARVGGRAARLRRWIYDPSVRGDVDRCIRNQLDCFRRLYGAPPTHVDGHTHVQLAPNVLLSAALADVARMRPALDRRGVLLALPRAARRIMLERRFATTDHCFDFADRERAVTFANGGSLELVTHPALRDLEALRSHRWRELVAGLPTGSYSDL
jgi:predicted glycoside hydrolase/deacetylase ChbG (UPF0249 family)